MEKCSIGQSPNLTSWLEIRGACVLRAKEGGRPSSVLLAFSSKSASLMVWGAYSMGSLHVLEATMNAEMYIKVLGQHMLPSR